MENVETSAGEKCSKLHENVDGKVSKVAWNKSRGTVRILVVQIGFVLRSVTFVTLTTPA